MSPDDEILAAESDLRRAQLSSDVDALDRLLDDALVFTTIGGTIATKSDDLALHRSRRLRITKLDPRNRQILHLGDTAVVNVYMDAEATMDGALMTAALRYTRVWHKRPEGWRVVAGHMSIVPCPESAPSS